MYAPILSLAFARAVLYRFASRASQRSVLTTVLAAHFSTAKKMKRSANEVEKRKKKIAKQTEKWLSQPHEPCESEMREYLTVEDACGYVTDSLMCSWMRGHLGIKDTWLAQRVVDHLPIVFIHDEAARQMEDVLKHTIRYCHHPDLLNVGRERFYLNQTQFHNDRTEAFCTIELLVKWKVLEVKSLSKWSVSIAKHIYEFKRCTEYVHVFARNTKHRFLKFVTGRFYLPYQLMSEYCDANLARIMIEYAYNMKSNFHQQLSHDTHEVAVF